MNRHGSINIRNAGAVAEVAAAAAKYHADAGRAAPPSPPSPPSPPTPPAAPSPPPSAPAAMAPWPVPQLAVEPQPAVAAAEGIFYYRAAFMWTRPLAPRVSASIDAQRTSDRLASGFPNALFTIDRRVYQVRTPSALRDCR